MWTASLTRCRMSSWCWRRRTRLTWQGTHVLPEAQLDRFFIRLSLGYPTLAEELRILSAQSKVHPIDLLKSVTTESAILEARAAVKNVYVEPSVAEYAARITAATRQHPELRLGASPRGTLALVRCAQGLAYIRGQDYATPELIKTGTGPTLAHRLIVRPQDAARGRNASAILQSILDGIPPPV